MLFLSRFGDTIFAGPFDCYGIKPAFIDTTVSFGYPYIPKIINDTIFYLPLDSTINKIPKFILRQNEHVYLPTIGKTDPYNNLESTSFSYYTGRDTIIKLQDNSVKDCWIFNTHDYLPIELDMIHYMDKNTLLPVKVIKNYTTENVCLEF